MPALGGQEVLDVSCVCLYGMLAQTVEQRTFNPFVVGSIPAHPTNKINNLANNLAKFFGSLFKIVAIVVAIQTWLAKVTAG
jgi:hypothetical protein